MPNVNLPVPFRAYAGKEPFIFISYAHKDGARVYEMITEMHKRGYRLWYDEGIEPGNEWSEEIARALDACATFVVFMSGNAAASNNVRNEINFALNRSKPFLAIYLEQIELPLGLELRMGDIQAILSWKMSDVHFWRKVEKTLPDQTREVPDPEVIPALPALKEEMQIEKKSLSLADTDEKQQRKKKWPWWIWAGVVAGLTVIITLISIFGNDRAGGQVSLSGNEPSPVPIQTDTPVRTDTPEIINTQTATPLPTATPGIGSSRISDVDGMKMVYVPAGAFIMGSDTVSILDQRPAHSVYLDAFWMDQTEVTNAMFSLCVEAGICGKPDNDYFDQETYADHPVRVNWNEADAYCTWVGKELPTEAQWEKAARGTDERFYPWGNSDPDCYRAHYLACSVNFQLDTIEVGRLKSGGSLYEVLDMAGNLAEWVADWYDADYYKNSPDENPENTSASEDKVVRGGAYDTTMEMLNAIYRTWSDPDSSTHGFRCIMGEP